MYIGNIEWLPCCLVKHKWTVVSVLLCGYRGEPSLPIPGCCDRCSPLFLGLCVNNSSVPLCWKNWFNWACWQVRTLLLPHQVMGFSLSTKTSVYKPLRLFVWLEGFGEPFVFFILVVFYKVFKSCIYGCFPINYCAKPLSGYWCCLPTLVVVTGDSWHVQTLSPVIWYKRDCF